MMKKSILIAALGLFSLNITHKTPRKKRDSSLPLLRKTLLHPLRTKTVPVRVGASQASVSWKVNCCVWVKENMTFPKCLSYTTQW